MTALIDQHKLDLYIQHNLNVLFIGKHGVGKTSAVIEAFERNKLKHLYFSASTCDPFIDFVGVPRVVEVDGKPVLQMIRQGYMEDDSVEAIFIDEYNRAAKKMKNAVMELIQFKSINGRKFPNLKVVWAAINPPDDQDTYDVEPLDPAQQDRFHIHINVDYRPCPEYLERTYGTHITGCIMDWWNAMPDNIREKVSPRRIGYAIDHWKRGLSMREMLPEECNVAKLIEALETQPIEDLVESFYQKLQNIEPGKEKSVRTGTATWLNHNNTLHKTLPIIMKTPHYMDAFIPLVFTEELTSLISQKAVVFDHFMSNLATIPTYQGVCESILEAHNNSFVGKNAKDSELAKRIRKHYAENNFKIPALDSLVYGSVNDNVNFQFTTNPKQKLSVVLDSLELNYSLDWNNPRLTSVTPSEDHLQKMWTLLSGAIGENLTIDESKKCARVINLIASSHKSNKPLWDVYNDIIPVTNHVSRSWYTIEPDIKDIENNISAFLKKLAFLKEDESYVAPRKAPASASDATKSGI